MVKHWRTDPQMIAAARSIVFMSPQKSDAAEADALFSYVRDNVRYVRDVLDIETLATPLVTLASRSGDCDDQSTLLATLLEAIGFRTCFVIAGYNDPRVFEHVYLYVEVDGAWLACDPTESEYFGWEPPDPVITWKEPLCS